MRAAVFIKQVPDVRAGAVGTRPDGTIDRSSAAAIINPVDLHAVEAALQVADDVTVITMGPPNAEEAVRQALAIGADQGVLVTDRAFAGSDTWATANVLSAAVAGLGEFDVYFCGTTALDGETGNVGPQLAERLGIPQATGCEGIEPEGEGLVVRRIVEGGYELLRMPTPALLTVAETGFLPRYPTLALRRAAAKAKVERLGMADLGIGEAACGLDASPTKVAHMELVPLPELNTKYLGTDISYQELAAIVRAASHSPTQQPRPKGHVPLGDPKSTSLKGSDVWVVCELRDGHLTTVSLELLAEANLLAAELATGVGAFIAGSGIDRAVKEAGEHGADHVFAVDDPQLASYRSLPHARVLADAIAQHQPEIVLHGATSVGRDLAPRIAARLDTGLAADCTDLRIDTWSRRGTAFEGLLHQIRPAMAGSVLATCICPTARPQIATVRPGVFSVSQNPKNAVVHQLAPIFEPGDLEVEVLERNVQAGDLPLSEASIVVAGGAGCGGDNWQLVEGLAQAVGGRVAATRAAVEAGLAPRSVQVGQTGTTIKPDLYIACGISGAFQHVVGMHGAQTIVAINRDPDAPIFRFAHYGVVADVTDALPRLTEALGNAIPI